MKAKSHIKRCRIFGRIQFAIFLAITALTLVYLCADIDVKISSNAGVAVMGFVWFVILILGIVTVRNARCDYCGSSHIPDEGTGRWIPFYLILAGKTPKCKKCGFPDTPAPPDQDERI